MAPGEKGGAAVVGRALTGKGQTPGPPSGGLVRQALLYGLIGGPEELTKILVDTFLFFISFQIQREFVYKRR